MQPRFSMFLACAALAACAPSVQYGSGDAARVLSSPADHGLVVADIMDGRRMGQPSAHPFIFGNEPATDLAELRASVREHAVNAGLVGEGGWIAPAPTTVEAAEQAMEEAARQGAEVVLFTRLEHAFVYGHTATVVDVFLALNYLTMLGIGAVAVAPSLIVFSLPINSEHGAVAVRGYLVDPRTKALLATFREEARLDDEDVTAWGHNPVGELPDLIFQAIDRVFERAARMVQERKVPPAVGPAAPALLAPPHEIEVPVVARAGGEV